MQNILSCVSVYISSALVYMKRPAALGCLGEISPDQYMPSTGFVVCIVPVLYCVSTGVACTSPLLSELGGHLLHSPVLRLGHDKEDVSDEKQLGYHKDDEHVGTDGHLNRGEAQTDQEVG